MAFQTLTAGDIHPTNMETLLAQLRTAVDERYSLGGVSPLAWSSSGIRSTRWRSDLEAMRERCEDMVAISIGGIYESSGFVKSDYTLYSGISEVLSDAGYGSGWIDIDTTGGINSQDNYRVSGSSFIALWQQVIDVLAEMAYYQFKVDSLWVADNVSYSYPSGNGERYGTDSDNEVAWDESRLDSVGTVTLSLARSGDIGWLGKTGAPSGREWYMLGPTAKISVDFTDFIGDCTGANFEYEIQGPQDFSLDVDDENSLSAYTTDGNTTSGAFDLGAAITTGAVNEIEYSITTTEPVDAPALATSPFSSGVLIRLVAGSATLADDYFYFDITSALTYG